MVFCDVIPCSFGRTVLTFRSNLLLPSLGQNSKSRENTKRKININQVCKRANGRHWPKSFIVERRREKYFEEEMREFSNEEAQRGRFGYCIISEGVSRRRVDFPVFQSTRVPSPQYLFKHRLASCKTRNYSYALNQIYSLRLSFLTKIFGNVIVPV
jgi:hypothetical protein